MKVLFVEPPKDVWFVMGEYLPPPYGIIQLAAYLENKVKDVEIKVLDCNAQKVDWKALEKQIEDFNPDIVASSALATCNTYVVARTLETAKKVNPNILTVTGGQHFTVTADESLKMFPEIDVIVRGEGEETIVELVKNAKKPSAFSRIKGISFRRNGEIFHTAPRELIENIDELPYPGYHFVKDLVGKYHFAAMAGRKAPYALIEGSRGCYHSCTFCTQWRHWQGKWRTKSPARVADEMAFCYNNYGSRFIWLTDDNLGSGSRIGEIAEEILKLDMRELMWFVQARCDDIVRNEKFLPKLRRSGLRWVLLGVENPNQTVLDEYGKNITVEDAKKAVRLLKKHDIAAHTMFIIGARKDTAKSIAKVREFVSELDPDFAIFAILTPFPGTQIYEEAKQNGWIEDFNWANYDMVHAIMPTETLSRNEVQEELYACYRSFYGSWKRRIFGIFSSSELRRRVYGYMARRGILEQIKALSRRHAYA
ncbi:cobalamin-dependent protein [Candidatus Bathyarchaeota archaeon]|nr:cobalamin-dependent protein [Candidatus Bathyarchaeota archaeon]